MKKFIALSIMVAFVATCAAVALAGDRGPQRVSVTTAATNTSYTVTPPVGDTGRFTPQQIIFSGQIGQTQTVYSVNAGVTNLVVTKVVAANDSAASLTNAPIAFAGDTLRIVTATNGTTTCIGLTNSVIVVGTLFD